MVGSQWWILNRKHAPSVLLETRGASASRGGAADGQCREEGAGSRRETPAWTRAVAEQSERRLRWGLRV